MLTAADEYIPNSEAGRIAVERARRIVKRNNDMIKALKAESQIHIQESPLLLQELEEAENFSFEGPYSFHTTKIKSSNGIKEFILDIFGAH